MFEGRRFDLRHFHVLFTGDMSLFEIARGFRAFRVLLPSCVDKVKKAYISKEKKIFRTYMHLVFFR